MPYSRKTCIYEMYSRIFYTKYHTQFDENDKQIMIEFSSFFNFSGAEEIFSDALYRYKRFYPKLFIMYRIKKDFIKYLKNKNASSQLIDIVPIFSKRTWQMVICAHNARKDYHQTAIYFSNGKYNN